MERWTIGSLLETAAGYLRQKGSTSPRLDAELLLAETLGLDRVRLYIEFDRPLTPTEIDHYRALISRRAAREPVAYITGRAYFRHLLLAVTPAVLIPRPETEELVEVALRSLRRRPLWAADREGVPPVAVSPLGAGATVAPLDAAVAPPVAVGDGPSSTVFGIPVVPETPLVADVGTGSGAIALSLAQEAGVRILATDSSAAALEVATRNAVAAGLEDLVEFRQADLLAGVADGSLRLVVSNPPYVCSEDMASLDLDIRLHEPVAALEAGPDGLAVIRRLLPEAARALGPGGTVLLEVGDGQAGVVAGLVRDTGFTVVTVHKDLSQKDRIVEATLPGALVASLEEVDEAGAAVLREALRAGALIGVPTDTVYGLAAGWGSQVGVRGLFTAKGRSPEQPVAVLFPSVEAIAEALPDLEEATARALEALLPGPFTFIVATRVPRPPCVGSADSLGVRVPGHPPLLRLLGLLGVPLAATSANLSGGKDAAILDEVDPLLLARCSLAFAGGRALAGEGMWSGSIAASTVIDLRPLSEGGKPVILREGAVPGRVVLERIAALR